MSNYSKFKERKPQDTVFEIQRILNGMGLFPVLDWIEKSYEGSRACRLTLYPSTFGTNGKGTDELYSSASAYAELMERMSNNILYTRDRMDPEVCGEGFRDFPDEKLVPIEEIASRPDPLTENMFLRLGLNDAQSRLRLLKMVSDGYYQQDGMLPVVPFADPASGELQWLPMILAIQMVGSNGMAAGNTLDEAMVQGLSEVFERAASELLIKGKAVPPQIPEEELKKYSLYHLIEQIHAEGRYSVRLYDCSMGKGWPVAGLGVFDLETGRFGFKLGAHPSFAVAFERTLTESLQGRSMSSFAEVCQAGSKAQAEHYHNLTNVAKVGNGYYPFSMFTETPGWEYKPWTRWEGLDNRGFLKGMIRLLKDEGLRPMVRDTSFLGFPSCHIIVPGFSEIYQPGAMFFRSFNSTWKAVTNFSRFPRLTPEEEDRLLRVIRFKRDSILENQTSFVVGRPLSPVFDMDRIAAYLHLKRGEFEKSNEYFRRLEYVEADGDEKLYLKAMAKYTSVRMNGGDGETARSLVRVLFRKDAAERVCADTDDLQTVMERRFPQLNCYDCENCPAAGRECRYPGNREVIKKILAAMKAENVDQQALLEELIGLYKD